jgi:hypothetical protein
MPVDDDHLSAIAGFKRTQAAKIKNMVGNTSRHEFAYDRAERISGQPFFTSVGPPVDMSKPQAAGEGQSNQKPGPGADADLPHNWRRDKAESLPEFDHSTAKRRR